MATFGLVPDLRFFHLIPGLTRKSRLDAPLALLIIPSGVVDLELLVRARHLGEVKRRLHLPAINASELWVGLIHLVPTVPA